jgi:hypothetical protein
MLSIGAWTGSAAAESPKRVGVVFSASLTGARGRSSGVPDDRTEDLVGVGLRMGGGLRVDLGRSLALLPELSLAAGLPGARLARACGLVDTGCSWASFGGALDVEASMTPLRYPKVRPWLRTGMGAFSMLLVVPSATGLLALEFTRFQLGIDLGNKAHRFGPFAGARAAVFMSKGAFAGPLAGRGGEIADRSVHVWFDVGFRWVIQ